MVVKPNFVGIGSMKCASTWVAECLRHHPEVLLSNPKETVYFIDHTGLEGYRRFFQEGGSRKAVGEVSPTYLPHASVVADRILETLGRVKLFAILRHPVHRWISHYKWLIGRRDDLDKRTFSTLDLRAFERANLVDPRMLPYGHYRDDLAIFVDRFGRENLHVMLAEDVDRDARAVARGLYDFIGVDPDFVPPSIAERVRQGYVPKYRFLEQVKVRLYFLIRNHAPWAIGPLKRLQLEALLRRINVERRDKLVVTPEVEQVLADHYAEEIERMGEFLGRRLEEWGRP